MLSYWIKYLKLSSLKSIEELNKHEEPINEDIDITKLSNLDEMTSDVYTWYISIFLVLSVVAHCVNFFIENFTINGTYNHALFIYVLTLKYESFMTWFACLLRLIDIVIIQCFILLYVVIIIATVILLYNVISYSFIFLSSTFIVSSVVEMIKKTSNSILNLTRNLIDKLREILNLVTGIAQSLVEYLIGLLGGLIGLGAKGAKELLVKVLHLLEYLLSLLGYFTILGIKELIDWVRQLIKDILDYLEDLDSKGGDKSRTKSINFFNLFHLLNFPPSFYLFLMLCCFFFCSSAIHIPAFI